MESRLFNLKINSESMQHFRINKEKIELIKRQVWKRLLLFIFLGSLIEIAIKYFHHDDHFIQQILIIGIVLSITHFRQTRKQIKIFESYVLSISETSFIRELKNSPAIEIE